MAYTRAGCIYIATNTATGEQYVGQTIQPLRARVTSHRVHSRNPKSAFHMAMHECGESLFEFVEFFVAFDRSALNAVEVSVISDLSPAYNSTAGGSGCRERKCSDATRAARSEAAKRRWANPEWREATIAKLRAAHDTPEAVERGRRLQQYGGGALRWAGHVKPTRRTRAEVDYSAQMAKVWVGHRDKIIAGLRAANERPEVRERRRNATLGRKMPVSAVAATAKAKWKPVYCPELQASFLSQKHAAEFFGVQHTSVCNAVKQKGKVKRQFSLVRVA